MATTVETIQLRVTADNKQVIAELKRLQRELGETGAKADSAKTKFAGLGGGIRGLAGAFGIGLGITALVSMGKSFLSLASIAETSLAKVATLADFTTAEIDAMRVGTQQLQAQFGISFAEISEARFDVISSGFADVADQQKILAAAFTLGAGNATDMTVATSTLTGVMSAFGRTAEDTNRTMDQLTLIAQGSKTNLEGLSSAITKLAPDAVDAGQSLATAGAALDVLTLAGLNADLSATAVGAAMRSIVTPAVIKNLNAAKIEVKDLETGAMRPLLDILKDLAAFPPEKIKTIIPSQEAQRAVSILIGKLDLFEAKINTIADENAMGVTAAAAAKAFDTLSFQTARLDGAIEALAAEGGVLNEQLKLIVSGWADILAIANTATKAQTDGANDVERAQARVLDINNQLAEAREDLGFVEDTLSKNFLLGTAAENRLLARKNLLTGFIVGATKQLEQAQRDAAKAAQEAAFIQPAVFGPAQPFGPFRPEPEDTGIPDPAQSEKDAKAVETVIQRTRLAIAKQTAGSLIEQERIKFDAIIRQAEAKNATEEQLDKLRILRSQVLNVAAAQEAIKTEKALVAERTRINKEAQEQVAELDRVRTEIFKTSLSEEQIAILDLQATWDERIERLRETGAEEVEINAAIRQSIDEVTEAMDNLTSSGQTLIELQDIIAEAGESLGNTLTSETAGGITAVFTAIGEGSKINFKALSGKMLQALGANSIALGTQALLAALIPSPFLFPTTGGPAAIGPALALIASGAALTASGAALSKSGGGVSAAGGGAPGGPGGAVAAERRGGRRRMDDELGRDGGAVIVNQNIQFLAPPTRAQIAQIADFTQLSLRQNFEDRQIDINLGTVV